MGKVIFGMTISLDGFVNDSNGSVARLYPDLADLRETKMLREAIEMTGAVVMGRHSYDMAQGDLTGYEFQTHIFVLTHNPPEKEPKGQNDHLKVIFVGDGIESAIRQAITAAGDKDVQIVGGPDTGGQALRKGLVDEIQIGVMPVLLGQGLRLFEQMGLEPLELEKIQVLETSDRTDIKFRVKK